VEAILSIDLELHPKLLIRNIPKLSEAEKINKNSHCLRPFSITISNQTAILKMRILNSILPIDNFLTHRPEQGNSVILVQHTLEGLQVQELQDPSI